MNNPLDPTLQELNNCGCCAGTGAESPAVIENRPGLPAVAFRAGVHSQFKATLLAALSSQKHPALRDLRTRETDDFTIALLDAFAGMADVLTFYSERIANEAYLRTATERRSVLELARAIGYELDPGVAAGVMLSFIVEGGAGARRALRSSPVARRYRAFRGRRKIPRSMKHRRSSTVARRGMNSVPVCAQRHQSPTTSRRPPNSTSRAPSQTSSRATFSCYRAAPALRWRQSASSK